MTPQIRATPFDEIAELLAEHGFDGLASAVTVLLNEVMKIERSHALGAGPYERSEQRRGGRPTASSPAPPMPGSGR